MKGFAFSFIAVAMVAAGSPAQAQYYEPSANVADHWEKCHDPGYLSATHGRGCEDIGRGSSRNYAGNYNDGNSRQVVVVQQHPQEGTCFLLLVICSNHGRRPHAGDTCSAANGVKYGLDKNLRWYRLPDSMPVRARSVTAICGDSDMYHADN